MIRTLEPQEINAKNRLEAVVYMKACNRRETETTVTFDVNYYILDIKYYQETVNVPTGEINELGGQITVPTVINMAQRYFIELPSDKAIYKTSTFYGAVGNPTPSEYDTFFISQIDYINSRVWTGNELQKVYFWHLRAQDCDIVTPEMLSELFTPFEVQ